jgi:hypothetical protein
VDPVPDPLLRKSGSAILPYIILPFTSNLKQMLSHEKNKIARHVGSTALAAVIITSSGLSSSAQLHRVSLVS